MLKVFCSLVVILAVFGSTDSAARSLPSYIESCNKNDPELNKCFMENGNKAIPFLRDGDKKLKIISFDPLKVTEATIKPGGNLKLTMKNIDFIGLGDGKIIDATADLKDKKFHVKLATPSISVIGDYEMDGRLVILPITGNGKANITAKDVIFLCNINYSIEEINGIEQLVLKETTIDYTTTRFYYHFGNLFNGEDSLLAKQMEKFLDENWEDVDKEFKGDLRILLASVIQAAISQIFKDVPFDQIFTS